MASESHEKLHFVVFPFMTQGHMIPMLDIAKLLAQQGVIITLITTPINANWVRESIVRALESGLPIKLVEVNFPREGFESLDIGSALEFYSSLHLLQKPVEKIIREIEPRPNCIISDMNLSYTSLVANNLNILRISFSGFSCFTMLLMDRVYNSKLLESISSETEYFLVPGLPHSIQITKQQLPGAAVRNFGAISGPMKAAEEATFGMIMNSFEELEPEYVKGFENLRKDYKVWCIGPVSLNNKENSDLIQRGENASRDESSRCLKWLDKQQPRSVLYICFGSLCNLVTQQLIELGLGLEASSRPFVWVIRGGEKSTELEKWIEEEGFEERTKTRSLIIRGWAPQLAILSHAALGGFLTHCGWNSVLEAVSEGVPMATWPLFTDHFMNERLVVDVLKIGVKVGAEVTMAWGEEEEIGVSVQKEDVEKAILKLMGEGEEVEEMRKRAMALSVKAKRALETNGSSSVSLKRLIEDIKLFSMRNVM